MVPFFTQPLIRLGPITVHAFGLIVMVATLCGLAVIRRRVVRLGMDPRVGEGMVGYATVAGFVMAHLFAVVFYKPRELAADPLLLFRLWEDISSFGGILGGLAGAAFYLKWRAPVLHPEERRRYLDALAFAFPFALTIGRLACTVAHDHPGTLTRFPLAVGLGTSEARDHIVAVYERAGRLGELPPQGTLAALGFHDLGWYEFLYLGLVVLPVLLVADRRPRQPGFYLRLFPALYLPVRFFMDFLRAGDARYAGLTPAQYVAAVATALLVADWLWRTRQIKQMGSAHPSDAKRT